MHLKMSNSILENDNIWIKREDESKHQQTSALPFVYSKHYNVKFGGLEKLHPFDASKGKHVMKHILELGILEDRSYHKPVEISKEELEKVHTKKYLKSLKSSFNAAKISEILPLIFIPNSVVQRNYLRPMRYQTAGSIMAGKLALEYGWAINLGGGFHHCSASHGGGFCAYADISLTICKLFEIESSIKKVLIIDLDAHQGNGYQRDFYGNANIYIFDMYNSSIYPRDHQAKLAINLAIELRPYTADGVYIKRLKRHFVEALNQFHPNIVIYNAGTDVLKNDPLGLLNISPEGVIERDEFVFSTCQQRKLPIVMLLSGGYLRSSSKVIADSVANLQAKGLLRIRNL